MEGRRIQIRGGLDTYLALLEPQNLSSSGRPATHQLLARQQKACLWPLDLHKAYQRPIHSQTLSKFSPMAQLLAILCKCQKLAQLHSHHAAWGNLRSVELVSLQQVHH